MGHRLPLVALVLLSACAPAHLHTTALTAGGRDLPELFLGGWDGRRLGLFDDRTIEPGESTHADLRRALQPLDARRMVVAYVDPAQLDASWAARRGFGCSSALCLVVFERGGGTPETWGEALAVFELAGAEDRSPVGRAWLRGRVVRPPGPTRWPMMCRTKDEPPRHVHPDGGALFPERNGQTDGWALFGGVRDVALSFLRDGFTAPSETTCDEEVARLEQMPAPERPAIEADPKLLGAPVTP